MEEARDGEYVLDKEVVKGKHVRLLDTKENIVGEVLDDLCDK